MKFESIKVAGMIVALVVMTGVAQAQEQGRDLESLRQRWNQKSDEEKALLREIVSASGASGAAETAATATEADA